MAAVSDPRVGGWPKFFAAMFLSGIVLGALVGLTSASGTTEFVTDSIEYDLREHWYVHALMIGLSFVAIAGALWFALLLVRRFGPLVPGAIVLTVLGGFALVLGALGVGGLETGQRIIFVVMGVVGLGFAARAAQVVWSGRGRAG